MMDKVNATHSPPLKPHIRDALNETAAAVLKAKFHFAIWSQTGPKLVADLQRAGNWRIIYELAQASRSVTSLGPVCDQIL